MAIESIQPSFKSLVERIFGSVVLHKTHYWNRVDTGELVLLTDELADHILEMYYNTDWDEFNGVGLINLPKNKDTGEVDEEAFRRYVGRHFYVSLFGKPWNDIHFAPSFIQGVILDFPDHLLELSSNIINSRDFRYRRMDIGCAASYLGNVALAMKADGVPDTYIESIIFKEIERSRDK